jgi:hypothetical protein
LHYGDVIANKQVTLNPSIVKTENAIGFTNEVCFAEAIKLIVDINYHIKL